MKRTLIFAAATLLLASCSKDPKADGPVEYPDPEPGTSYVLEGTVNTPGFTWAEFSAIGLYSTNVDVIASNLECTILSQDAGKAVACFDTPPLDLVKGENSFLVYSPYDADLIYLNGVIYSLEVANAQVQSAPNVAGSCFAIGTATGIAAVDETFTFTMNPVTALAKVAISTSELAGYALKKVTLWDEDETTKLAGAFNVNTNTLTFTTIETYNRASTTINAPATLTSGTAQNIYINLLPGDYASKELWMIIELEKGVERVTIPMKKSDLVFTAGQTTEITISDLKLADNAASAWYHPVETRYLTALGYAYGDANTYFIQCKSGSTYTGATYTPNANYPDEVTIDFKARGNFFNVIDPRGATFEWARLGALQPNGNGPTNGAVYTPSTANYLTNTGVDPTKFTFQTEGETTVKVKNTGAFAGAPILLMIKDGKILWAWAFWNIAADGTAVTPVTAGSYQLANMDIGQATTQYNTWVANKHTNGTSPDLIFRTTHYYQWGRPIPTFWTSYYSMRYGTAAGNCPRLDGPMSMADALANPVGLILHPVDDTTLPHWCTEQYGDLWGNCNPSLSSTGVKSIYDPCPKGWRVADRAVYDYLITLMPSNLTGFSYANTPGYVGINLTCTSPSSLFPTQGYGEGRTNATLSPPRLRTMGLGESGALGSCGYGFLWANHVGAHDAGQPAGFYYANSNYTTAEPTPRIRTFDRTANAAVRCQVDAENR